MANKNSGLVVALLTVAFFCAGCGVSPPADPEVHKATANGVTANGVAVPVGVCVRAYWVC